jgi:hypothetical protein
MLRACSADLSKIVTGPISRSCHDGPKRTHVRSTLLRSLTSTTPSSRLTWLACELYHVINGNSISSCGTARWLRSVALTPSTSTSARSSWTVSAGVRPDAWFDEGTPLRQCESACGLATKSLPTICSTSCAGGSVRGSGSKKASYSRSRLHRTHPRAFVIAPPRGLGPDPCGGSLSAGCTLASGPSALGRDDRQRAVAGFEGGGHALSVALGAARDRVLPLSVTSVRGDPAGSGDGHRARRASPRATASGGEGSGPGRAAGRPPSRMTARGRLCASARDYRRRRWPPSVISAWTKTGDRVASPANHGR